RDPEGSAPDPPVRGLDRVAAAECLGEGLGHRVARELRVPREGGEGAPELLSLLPPDTLDEVASLSSHYRIVNLHALQGVPSAEPCRWRVGSAGRRRSLDEAVPSGSSAGTPHPARPFPKPDARTFRRHA